MNEIGQKRKQRSDKKREIKPTIKLELKDAIYRMSYITRTPVKNVAESMIDYAATNQDVIDNLSPSFQREVKLFNTLYCGRNSNQRASKRDEVVCERIHFRLTQKTYATIAVLAYALDISASRVCALLLDVTIRDIRFVNMYVSNYLKEQLTTAQMNELQSILNYVNDDTEVTERMSWASLLSLIVDEITEPATKIKEGVNEFIINKWK